MAEGEGFEPPVPFQAQRFSRPPVSTAHPSLREAWSCLNCTSKRDFSDRIWRRRCVESSSRPSPRTRRTRHVKDAKGEPARLPLAVDGDGVGYFLPCSSSARASAP